MRSCEISGGAPLRIILVLGDLATTASGPNTVVQRLAAWLVNHGYDVTIVGTWRGCRPDIEGLRVLFGQAHIALHRRYFKDTWHFAPGAIRFAVQLLSFRKPFIIDIHGVWLFNGLVLALVAKLKQWRYFVTLHGNLRPVTIGKNKTLKVIALSLFFKWWLRSASGLIALNEREKYEASEFLPDASICVLGNAVKPHPSSLTTTRSSEVLFLGRIDPIKNLESLIDGFSQISSEFPNWRLSIVGPPVTAQYLEQLKSRSLALNLEQRIMFHDAAYGEEKESRLLAASIFALTSWSEGQPFAVLEAMAHGLPVLLSDQCNIEVPRNCGRICGCKPEEIAQALKGMLVLSEEQLRHMGSEALHFVSREFSEDSVFSERLSLYFVQG